MYHLPFSYLKYQYLYNQRQIQHFPKGRVRVVVGMDIEYLGNFVAGHIMQCVDKMLADKMPVDKTSVEIARKDKLLAILLHIFIVLIKTLNIS